ncbi:MAG: ShlB/FhaC/HecB family hemolysin secretion/activation protein [Methylophilaceae bacterium]|nr:MAG: ShlB/FhaC/HecB family hemolysin secretion/activation protein [Methylophilaceae bacterium]
MVVFAGYAAAQPDTPLLDITTAETDSTSGDLVTEEMVKDATSPGDEAPPEAAFSFDVFEYLIDGNTVLENIHIEKAVYPFLGEAKTIQDVEQARSALEQAYQNMGYLTVSVSIPEQDVDDGLVRLLVTEGVVERLRIKDAKYTTHALLKSRVKEFEEGKVPHFPTAQAQLDTANRNQNRQVAPILRPGKSPGKVEVDLQVQDKFPLHGSLELNDRFAPSTTKTRLNGSMRYENLWQKDHSLGLSFQASPEDFNEVKVFSGTYVIPRKNGDYFAMYAVMSESDIAAVGDVNVIGNGRISGVRYIHPLKGSEHYYHSVTLGADYKDFKESVILLGADTTINSPVSYLGFSLGYDGTIQTPGYQTQMNITMTAAPRGLGNTEKEFNNRRQNATPNFAYLRSEVKHLQRLPYDWTLQTRFLGQLSNTELIAPEQFAVGGVDSVRGYLESSSLGDNGMQLAFELRTPPLKKYLKEYRFADYVKDFYLFGFYDAGVVKIYNSPNDQSSEHVTSTGLGFKLKATSGLFAYLDYAYAFKDSIQVDAGDERLHFRLGYEW